MKKNNRKETILKSIPIFVVVVFATGTINVYAWSDFSQSDDDFRGIQKRTFQHSRETKQREKFDSVKNLSNKSKIRTATENNDYQKFKELTKNNHLYKQIDEDIFAKIVKAHGLRMQGNFEEARAIMQEIGFRPLNNSPSSDR